MVVEVSAENVTSYRSIVSRNVIHVLELESVDEEELLLLPVSDIESSAGIELQDEPELAVTDKTVVDESSTDSIAESIEHFTATA